MKLEDNRIHYAKYQIFRYAESLFIRVCDLLAPTLQENLNLPAHGLTKQELIIVLYELFSTHQLVAKRDGVGLFTPTLTQIEQALAEEADFLWESKNTFYGMTTGAHELYQALGVLYQPRE